MRCPVIDSQCGRPPPNIDAQRFPGEGLLKDSLAQVSREEEAIRPASTESRQKPQLRDTDILGFIDHCELKRRMRGIAEFRRHPAKQAGVGDQTTSSQCVTYTLENRPKHGSLGLL